LDRTFLKSNEPFKRIGSIGNLYDVIPFVAGVIDVDCVLREWLHRLREFTRPVDVRIGVCGIGPTR
jgi:hypothetical protein